MIERHLTIINKLGLHARAATKFAHTANQFSSKITVTVNEKSIDGKSIMSLMLLAAAKGTIIHVCADGNDEQTALESITELIENRFGEDE